MLHGFLTIINLNFFLKMTYFSEKINVLSFDPFTSPDNRYKDEDCGFVITRSGGVCERLPADVPANDEEG